MNKTPSILVDTGFEVDQNGNLNGVIIPSSVQNIAAAPISITTYAETIKWLPNTSSTLQSLVAPNVVSFSGAPDKFLSNINVANIDFPALTTPSVIMFFHNTRILTVRLPSLSQVPTEMFTACTGLTSVTLGSEGKPVTSITSGGSSSSFNGCTQANLTITIYTQGGAALAGSPWGATNATIVWEEA